MNKIVVALTVLTVLVGCHDAKAKLHMVPNQDEQACLDSEKLNFKDPDVLFVANLGDRGWKLSPNTYWVRYKAKNSYGAYLQGNMLCKKTGENWVRDFSNEVLIKMAITADLMDVENNLLQAGKEMSPRYRSKTSKFADIAFEHATEIVDESPNSLTKYVKPSTNTVGENNRGGAE